MPERGLPGGVRPGIQQYGNVRGKKRTALEKLADKKDAEGRPDPNRRPVGPPSLPRRRGPGPPNPMGEPYPKPMTRTFDRKRAKEQSDTLQRKSDSARKAAATRAAKKKAGMAEHQAKWAKIDRQSAAEDAHLRSKARKGRVTTFEAPKTADRIRDRPLPKAKKPIPPERTVSNPFPQQPEYEGPRKSGVKKTAAAIAVVTAGGIGLSGGKQRENPRSRSEQADIGRGGHDRPSRPLPSTRSTAPAYAKNPARGTQGVPKASTGMYGLAYVKQGKAKYGGGDNRPVSPAQLKFAKGQLGAADVPAGKDGRAVVNLYKTLNRGAASRRAAAGAGKAVPTGHYSALSAGQRSPRSRRVPR